MTLAPRGRLVTGLLVAGLLGACHHGGGAPPPGATRVVSLSPSTTEAMFAMGAGGLLVGRSRFCDYPPDVAHLPEVGGYIDPNLEAILGLRPTLVVGARGPAGAAVVRALEQGGIATFFPEADTLADVDTMLLGIGARTGHDAEARATVTRLDARIASIEATARTEPRPRVLLVFGLTPVVGCGPGGFADEMLRRAGGENVIAQGGPYPMLGMERILAADPDVVLNAAVLEAHGDQRLTTSTPGWRELRAVREGRVVPLGNETVLRPGPRVAEGLLVIARAIHPRLAFEEMPGAAATSAAPPAP